MALKTKHTFTNKERRWMEKAVEKAIKETPYEPPPCEYEDSYGIIYRTGVPYH